MKRTDPPTLPALRAYVLEVARDLDPQSRYVSELLAVLDACRSVEEYLARLEDREQAQAFRQDGAVASRGERGYSWLDDATWRGMDPWERTLSNLLTGETRMMWAGEAAGELARLSEALRRAPAASNPVRVLSVPCSTGKETWSLAIGCLEAGLEVEAVGVDRQPAYVERAASGRFVPHQRDWEHPWAARWLVRQPDGSTATSPEVLRRCRFERGDVLTGELPPGPFDLVSCRNLLGYFRGASLERAWTNVAARVRPGGLLLHDYFVTGGEPMAPVRALLEARGFQRLFPDTSYYRAPEQGGS